MIHANDIRHQLDVYLTQAKNVVLETARTPHGADALATALDELAHQGDARRFRRTLATLRHHLDPVAYGDLIPLYLRITTLRRQLHRTEAEIIATA